MAIREKKRTNCARTREILSILRRRKIHRGLTPEKLRLVIEDMGPTFMKLGQIASSREDLLPAAYCSELSKLRTMVALLPAEEIRGVIEKECGVSVSEVFSSFEDEPIGAASIAQVHRAVLKDGSPVVVKVQRPDIRQVMEQDMALLMRVAGLINRSKAAGELVDFKALLGELWKATQQELDFCAEAGNIEEFARKNADASFVSCPRVYSQYSNASVLVMEQVEGIPISDTETLQSRGYDLKELGSMLVGNYAKQILEDGFFHADPHSGNIIIRDGVIVWIDLGLMGRLTERDRSLLKKAFAAVVEQDILAIKEVLLTLGAHKGRVDHARLYADIDDYLTRYASMSLQEATTLNMSDMMEEMMGMARRHGISMPRGITMLGRGMMVMESLLLQLHPDVDFVTVLANHFSAPLSQTLDIDKLLHDSGRSLFVSMKKGLDLPAQLSDFLRMTIKGHSRINLELSGSDAWDSMINRQVNKLVITFLTIAVIIGSSVLCTLRMAPAIWGIPAPALIGFGLSAILTLRLLLLIRK